MSDKPKPANLKPAELKQKAAASKIAKKPMVCLQCQAALPKSFIVFCPQCLDVTDSDTEEDEPTPAGIDCPDCSNSNVYCDRCRAKRDKQIEEEKDKPKPKAKKRPASPTLEVMSEKKQKNTCVVCETPLTDGQCLVCLEKDSGGSSGSETPLSAETSLGYQTQREEKKDKPKPKPKAKGDAETKAEVERQRERERERFKERARWANELANLPDWVLIVCSEGPDREDQPAAVYYIPKRKINIDDMKHLETLHQPRFASDRIEESSRYLVRHLFGFKGMNELCDDIESYSENPAEVVKELPPSGKWSEVCRTGCSVYSANRRDDPDGPKRNDFCIQGTFRTYFLEDFWHYFGEMAAGYVKHAKEHVEFQLEDEED